MELVFIYLIVLCNLGVSEADKKIILEEHNKYRANTSPPAKNMQKMVRSISYVPKKMNELFFRSIKLRINSKNSQK